MKSSCRSSHSSRSPNSRCNQDEASSSVAAILDGRPLRGRGKGEGKRKSKKITLNRYIGSPVKAGQPGQSPLVQMLRGELKPLMPFGAADMPRSVPGSPTGSGLPIRIVVAEGRLFATMSREERRATYSSSGECLNCLQNGLDVTISEGKALLGAGIIRVQRHVVGHEHVWIVHLCQR